MPSHRALFGTVGIDDDLVADALLALRLFARGGLGAACRGGHGVETRVPRPDGALISSMKVPAYSFTDEKRLVEDFLADRRRLGGK